MSKPDPDFLEELAPEMYAIIKAFVESYPYDAESCINEIRPETDGCRQCRAVDAGRLLLEAIKGTA